MVGGCVRNILNQDNSTDIDIATQVLPEPVMQLLQANNIACIPLKYGTVTAILNNNHYEITTLRRDIEGYGRNADIEYTSDWLEDALRRDFTINAMYLDLKGNLYDYFRGQEHLTQKLIKFVGEPKIRIKEDYLRILRYFRFYAYFGGSNIDIASLTACREEAQNIARLSGERVQTEMLKLLGYKFALTSLRLMDDILPVLGIKIENPVFWELKLSDNAVVNLAALIRYCSGSEDVLNFIKERWRLSNKLYDLLKFLIFLPFDIESATSHLLKIIYEYGKDRFYLGALALGIIQGVDLSWLAAKAEKIIVPAFPIKGSDLKGLGYNGKELGEALKQLKKAWLESGLTLTRQELLAQMSI